MIVLKSGEKPIFELPVQSLYLMILIFGIGDMPFITICTNYPFFSADFKNQLKNANNSALSTIISKRQQFVVRVRIPVVLERNFKISYLI